MRTRRMQRQLVPALRGAGGTVLLFVGVPAALALSAGWPLPWGLPGLGEVSDALAGGWRPEGALLLRAVALVAWVLWVQLSASVVFELRALRSGSPGAGSVPGASWCHPLAVRLAAAIFAGSGLLLPRAAGAVVPPAAAPAIAEVHSGDPTALEPGVESAVDAASTAIPPPAGHLVAPGDTLWDLAETHLGDPRRWPELYEVNRGRTQPDGRSLVDPGLIRSGWHLVLPDSPAPSAADLAPALLAGEAPFPAPGAVDPPVANTTLAPHDRSATNLDSQTQATGQGGGSEHRHGAEDEEGDGDDGIPSPQDLRLRYAAVVGMPALLAGACVGYLGSLLADRGRYRQRGRAFSPLAPVHRDAERRMRAVADCDVVALVDLALRHLGAALGEAEAPPVPTVVVVRGGEEGVELLVSPPWPVAPGCFVPADDGHVWRLGPAVSQEELSVLAEDRPAPFPALVSVGEMSEGTLLIDLSHVGALSVCGEADQVEGVLTAIALELASAPWAGDVEVCLVGGDRRLEVLERVWVPEPDTAVAQLRRRAAKTAGGGLRAVLAGEIPAAPTVAVVLPGALEPEDLRALVTLARPHSGLVVVTGDSATDLRWRLEVGSGGEAVLHPLGLAVVTKVDGDAVETLFEMLARVATKETDVPGEEIGAPYGGVEFGEAPAETVEVTHSVEADEDPALGEEKAPSSILAAEVSLSPGLGAPAIGSSSATEAVASAEGVAPTLPLVSDGVASPFATADEPLREELEYDDPGALIEARVLGPVEVAWPGKAPTPKVGECVVYVATHPPAVTGERLRLALWPVDDSDERFGERSAATFYSVVSRARRALGKDAAGEDLLARSGADGYRLSPEVSCDWVRFQLFVRRAKTDPGEAQDALRQALALVRGRPFADIPRACYAWVALEGLVHRRWEQDAQGA